MNDLRGVLHERIERRQLELPVLPRAAQEVLSLAADEACDLRRVADAIRSDPTLAAHVLRVVNSPMFRARTPVVSLPQALARLGTVRVRQVMLVIACEARALRVRGREREAEAWLAHALDTAFFAQEIARVRRQSVEEAFLCGLLHDVGMPVLWQLLADLEAEGLVAPARDAREEAAALDELHAQVGALVAGRWELPTRVVAAIASHHAPVAASAGSGERPVFARVALVLADALADAGEDALGRAEVRAVVEALELYPEELDAVVASRRALAEAA